MTQQSLWNEEPQKETEVFNSFQERPYQVEAREAIEKAFEEQDAIIVEMATGLGKTEIFTQLIKQWEIGRCLVIAPQITLIGQAYHKISKRTGIAPGIEQAHNWSDETPWGRSPFVVASKQTLERGRYQRIRDVGLVIVDECHLSITSSWAKMLTHFMNDGAKVLGVTATAKRHDKKSMKNIYQGCAYQYGIVDGIRDGWLCNARTLCVELESLDLSGVTTSNTVLGRDFNQQQLNAKLESWETIFEIAEVTAKETRGLKTVVYCSSVEEARMVSDRLADHYGINSKWICADTNKCSKEERISSLQSFTSDPNGVTHLCNVGILTTGWDFPGLEAIVMARPTKSKSLYTQIFGRGTRPLEGVVDFAGSTPESRRAAIASSAKPSFKMIDLVDASIAHKIMTSPNVMAGTWGVEVVERVKKKMDEEMDLEEAMSEADKEVREEREQLERQERARVQAQVQYRTREVDPFSNDGTKPKRKKEKGARFLFGRFKGLLVREIPSWYLQGVMNDKPKLKEGWLKQAIRRELQIRDMDF